MAKHREHMEAYILKLGAAKNTKIMSVTKHRNIVSFLKNKKMDLTTLGIPKSVVPKFKHIVVKKKKYRLVDFPKFGLVKALCVPAKNKVSQS